MNRYLPKRKLRNAVPVANTWLSERQHLAITMYATGYKAPDIAKELRISVKTVEGHVQRAMHRLNCKTIYQAVAIVAASNALEAAA